MPITIVTVLQKGKVVRKQKQLKWYHNNHY